MSEPILVDTREAAALIGVSAMSVRRLIRTGELPATRLGKRKLYVPREAINNLAASATRRTEGGAHAEA